MKVLRLRLTRIHELMKGSIRIQPTTQDLTNKISGSMLLRPGALPRRGNAGVARHPSKHDKCAKLDAKAMCSNEEHYFCAKDFEKPRIAHNSALLKEDAHRKGLWRLYLPRNHQQHLVW